MIRDAYESEHQGSPSSSSGGAVPMTLPLPFCALERRTFSLCRGDDILGGTTPGKSSECGVPRYPLLKWAEIANSNQLSMGKFEGNLDVGENRSR